MINYEKYRGDMRMKSRRSGLAALLLVAAVMTTGAAGVAAAAGESGCGFRKKVGNQKLSYSVVSSKANGCGVQVVAVNAVRNGTAVAQLRSDVDYVAHTALTGDLDDDGLPELVLVSREWGKENDENVDVYCLDGSRLVRSSLPKLNGLDGYRGGDSLWIDGKQLVRSFPLYEQGEQPNGTRVLRYEMVNHQLQLYVQNDLPPLIAEPAAIAETTGSASAETPMVTAAEKAPVVAGPAPLAAVITAVEIVDNGIVLKTSGTVGSFKTMRLDRPERIAIDFKKGKTVLTQKTVAVGKFGISRIRIGSNKGFIRFVLDTTAKKFPRHTVTAVGDGVKIEFQE